MKRVTHVVLLVCCIVMPDVSWAGFDEGLAAYNRGNYATALKEWRPLAEQGNAVAQNSVGVAYEKGYGVVQNHAEAVKLYTKAAVQGNESAQFNLGRMYTNGRGVIKNDVEAVKWYAKAARQGNAAAQNNLGWMYANGYGVEKNNAEATKWFTKAAAQGNANSQRLLGFINSKEASEEKKNSEAAKWYAKVAEQFEINVEQGDVSAKLIRVSNTKQNKATKASKAKQEPKAGRIFRDCPGCPEMVVIPSGSFDMGSPDSESGRGDDESPVHRVNVAAFALGKTEITRSQFAAFVKKTKYRTDDMCWTLEGGKFESRSANWGKPGYPQDDKHPVICINWNDAKAYANWMSRKTGKKYRLPTEAEWEYAARGNTSTSRYWGVNPDEACEYANAADDTAQAQIHGASSWWVHKCMDGFAYTAPVGSFKANAFGLKDMLGNAWEWTEDGYHDSYEGAPTDGSARQGDGAKRVIRGGSWNNSPQNVRAAVRDGNKPELRFSIFGFRLARRLP